MSLRKHSITGEVRDIPDATLAALAPSKAAVWQPYTPPEPEAVEPQDYPITKDTIVWRMKQMGKLASLMAFTESLTGLLAYEYRESAYFERSTWAQYAGYFGLTQEELDFLLAQDDSPTLR